jgi:hypothetical protein
LLEYFTLYIVHIGVLGVRASTGLAARGLRMVG